MEIEDLDGPELFEWAPDGGVIRVAGQRALLLDALAMGVLRKHLVDNFGFTAARTILTQFGFAHGWRMAEAMKDQFEWDSPDQWRQAGARLHALEGLFRERAGGDALGPLGTVLVESYEAEQHLLHFGQADTPSCWTICGLLSGYLSRTQGVETIVLEDRCLAKGDAACRMLGRTRAEWGEDRASELRYFEPQHLRQCLDVPFNEVTKTLRELEAKLHANRRAYVEVSQEEVPAVKGIVAKSRSMLRAVDRARRMARVDTTLLITGDSGVGKERIARLVHNESTRAKGPFLAVNCGAITETLLESELFGHIRGAFTGADVDRPGLFEAAKSGTLLLDEIGDISAGMQVKLLRVLQERTVRRVGANISHPIDVRILAATNRDLASMVEQGSFREDLFYRIKVVEIHVPALRERRADVLVLARVLLALAARRMNRPITGFTPAAADQLLRYPWPGNVRELENAVEHAVALALGDRIEPEDLPEEVRVAEPVPPWAATGVQRLEDVTKAYILASLEANHGNQTRTAEQLGIGTATLYRRLKKYGVIAQRRAAPTKAC